MKTIKDRINEALAAQDYDSDSINRLILYAYEMGYEAATKHVSDTYSARIRTQREYDAERKQAQLKAANACRYHKLVRSVLDIPRKTVPRGRHDGMDYIYFSEYSAPVTRELALEETSL